MDSILRCALIVFAMPFALFAATPCEQLVALMADQDGWKRLSWTSLPEPIVNVMDAARPGLKQKIAAIEKDAEFRGLEEESDQGDGDIRIKNFVSVLTDYTFFDLVRTGKERTENDVQKARKRLEWSLKTGLAASLSNVFMAGDRNSSAHEAFKKAWADYEKASKEKSADLADVQKKYREAYRALLNDGTPTEIAFKKRALREAARFVRTYLIDSNDRARSLSDLDNLYPEPVLEWGEVGFREAWRLLINEARQSP